jgi:tetratricopeptide (TPR) repeat protein
VHAAQRTPGTLIISALTGAPGVGKTALAVHWAHRAAGRYPDGQLYVDLRGYSTDPPLRPIEALRRMLTVCGVAGERIPADADDAAGLFRSLLAGRRMLVVLDNAAAAEQVRPLLPGGPGCLVLVTSRDRLDGLVAMQGARRVGLDVLARDEAVTLVARIIGEDRVRAEPGAATELAELAELCGQLPLALRIAAAQLAGGQDPIAQYVAGLRAGYRVARLAVGGDERHAAVEAAFDRSYTGLSILERRVFRLAALAPGADFTVEAAAALAGIPADRAVAAVSGLTRAHLVQQRAGGRYQFHDLLRLYAQAQSRAEDEATERDAALLRLVTEHAASATAASLLLYPQKLRLHPQEASPDRACFADNAAALAWFDAERVNLVAAVCEAGDRPWPAVGQLAYALRGYLEGAHHLDDFVAVATRGLAVMSAVGDARGEAASRISLASARACRAEFDEAQPGFTAALAGARRHDWPDIEAVALNNLGILYEKTGRLDQAAEHYGGALVLYRRIGWHVGLGMCHANLGYVYYLRGMLEQAAANQAEALRLATRDGAVGVCALALEHLGAVFHARWRLAAALDHLNRALERYREMGNRYGESSALQRLGAAHRDAGDHARARELAQSALSLARDIGHGDAHMDALVTLGGVCLCLGDPTGAAAYHKQALALAGDLGQPFAEAQALIGLAAAYRALGHPVPALASGRRALARARRRGYRLLEGQAGAELAAIHLGCGRAGPAARRAALARPLLAGSGAEEDAAQLDALLSAGLAGNRVDR